MNLKLGKKVRELRKGQNVTQEELAEYLGISYQAVSKWENGLAYPDITLIPAIANFFQITTDTLFGMNDQIEKEEIEIILKRWKENNARGLIKENEKLIRDGLKEYPNNFKLIYRLCHTLFNQFSGRGQTELLDEIIIKASIILRDCTEDQLRYSAMQLLAHAFNAKGEKDKAKEIADRLPSSSITKDGLLESILEGEEQLKHIQKNMLLCLERIGQGLDMLSRTSSKAENYSDALYYLELKERLFSYMFENEDYNFYNTTLALLYYNKAKLKILLKKYDEAVEDLETGANYGIAMDRTSLITQYTSRSFKYLTHDRTKVVKNYMETDAELYLRLMESELFVPIKDRSKFLDIKEKLTSSSSYTIK